MRLVAVTDDGYKLHDYAPLDVELDEALERGRLLGVRPVCSRCGLPVENRIHTGQGSYLKPVIDVKPERVLEILDAVSGDLAATPGYANLRSAFAAAIAEEVK